MSATGAHRHNRSRHHPHRLCRRHRGGWLGCRYLDAGAAGWLVCLAAVAVVAALHGVAAALGAGGRSEEVASELATARLEMDALREQIAELRDRVDDMPDSQSIVAELKILYTLLEQIPKAGKAAKKSASPAAASPQAGPQDVSKGDAAKDASDTLAPSTEIVAEQPVAKVPGPNAGRAPLMVYDDGEILTLLENALREDKVELYLQPVFSLPQRQRDGHA
jgi:cyclic-di-GMP phosphodiesterase TipF (flagellum assembly factor)